MMNWLNIAVAKKALSSSVLISSGTLRMTSAHAGTAVQLPSGLASSGDLGSNFAWASGETSSARIKRVSLHVVTVTGRLAAPIVFRAFGGIRPEARRHS